MIKRELALFLAVGTLTVLVDFAVYRGLVWTGTVNVNVAKGVSFLVGTVFAYFANRYWTFGHYLPALGSTWRFAVLYSATLGTNVLLNELSLKLLGASAGAVQWAFLMATAVSAALNFLGMKFFVFKSTSRAATS